MGLKRTSIREIDVFTHYSKHLKGTLFVTGTALFLSGCLTMKVSDGSGGTTQAAPTPSPAACEFEVCFDLGKDRGLFAIKAGTTEDLPNSHALIGRFSRSNRYFAFAHNASDLVDPPLTGNHSRVYLKDFSTGALTLESMKTDGTINNADCREPNLSSNGRYLVFSCTATNLTGDTVTAGRRHVYWKDRQTGLIKLVSATAANAEGNNHSVFDERWAHVSDDGNVVTFASTATNLVTGYTLSGWNVFQKNMTSGAVTLVTVNPANSLPANQASWPPVVEASADGSKVYVKFSNVVANYSANGLQNLFLHNLTNGTLTNLSKNADGIDFNQNTGWMGLSPNGRYIVFHTTASNVLPDLNTNVPRWYRLDLNTGQFQFIATSASERAPMMDYSGDIVLVNSVDKVGTQYPVAAQLLAYNFKTGVKRYISVGDQGQFLANSVFFNALSMDGRWSISMIRSDPYFYDRYPLGNTTLSYWQSFFYRTGF